MTAADPVSPEERTALRLTIHGRVQRVGYRGWLVGRATALGLDGWVRNRRDGTVEALVAGPASAVARLVADCRGGPPAARVARVDSVPAPLPPAGGFEQLPTG